MGYFINGNLRGRSHVSENAGQFFHPSVVIQRFGTDFQIEEIRYIRKTGGDSANNTVEGNEIVIDVSNDPRFAISDNGSTTFFEYEIPDN